jgi:hypothetical protein
LETPAVLDDPELQRLINMALPRVKMPLDPGNPCQLIIKSISAKQRPRKPAAGDKVLPPSSVILFCVNRLSKLLFLCIEQRATLR